MNDIPFKSAENQALLVLCARKTIRTAAILGIIWGVVNLVIGFFAVKANLLNAGILFLALLMLGAGIAAIRNPSHKSLRTEAVISVLLLCWNVGIAMINARAGYANRIDGHSLIFPAIAAAVFFRQYNRLGHIKEQIETMDGSRLKEAAALCKQLFKTKLKNSPDIAQESRKRCRFRLMTDSVFCAHKNLAHAFCLNRTDFKQCILNPEKKRVRVVVIIPSAKSPTPSTRRIPIKSRPG
jgi:hypothetical protein